MMCENKGPKDPLLTLEEAAEQLHIPVATLRWYRATKRGELKTFTVGRRVVTRQSDVDAFIEAAAAN